MSREGLLLLSLLAGYAADPPPAPGPAEATGRFEPAPMPSVQVRRTSTVGSLEIPIGPKQPPGTGAVPVSSSPFRGSLVTGIKEAF